MAKANSTEQRNPFIEEDARSTMDHVANALEFLSQVRSSGNPITDRSESGLSMIYLTLESALRFHVNSKAKSHE